MDDLERLEVCLSDTLEMLMNSAELARNSNLPEAESHLRRIGDATNLLWEVREAVYAAEPELERGTPSEASRTENDYAAMKLLSESAHRDEDSGRLDEAINGFEKLRARSTSAYYRRLAEAGLFRVRIASVKQSRQS